jgi:uncharacterized protein YjiK
VPRTIISGPRSGRHAVCQATVGILLLVLASSCHSRQANEPATGSADFQQWSLPDRLREISGLALTPDQRLLAIDDEQAVVYELDYEDGRIVKSFAFGNPVMRGDFEGIAVLQDKVWIMTSDGTLFAATEGEDGRAVNYEKFTTGHGDYCELEGLAQDRAANTLLLACKETHSKNDSLMAFEWLVSPDGIEFSRSIILPGQAIAERIGRKRVNPSGIAIDPANRDWLMVAARQRALLRLTSDGGLSEAIILPKKDRHRQAEGIEMTGDGRLLIADEGGNGKGRLAVYHTAPTGNHEDE